MRIALINENSQADKNLLIYEKLCKSAEKNGHEVLNFGKYSKQEERDVPYTELGLFASVLISTGIADIVVTGCGTGQGAAISCNSMSNLVCGIIHSPLDMYLFSQINAGNAISIPYSQKFGWGSDVELEQIFDILCSIDFGKGYPEEYAEAQRKSKLYIEEIKSRVGRNLLNVYKEFEDTLKRILNTEQFKIALSQFGNSSAESEYISAIMIK